MANQDFQEKSATFHCLTTARFATAEKSAAWKRLHPAPPSTVSLQRN
ncbi:hypothetical protein EVA_17745 [gut metagenome]|uniref:Uncharacterized protein n=1 Tax=gut metagenome TaxID=749906 RepID=J9G3P3_9ZZZZ